MHKQGKKPLLEKSHWLLPGASLVLLIYGVASLSVSRWLATQAIRGSISVGSYQSRLASFYNITGAGASILLIILFLGAVLMARGIMRTAFVFAALAGFGPLLVAQSANLLFNIIGLPAMGAGSVIAAAAAALLYTLPLMVMFILIAAARRNLKSIRWLALISIFIALAAMIYPIYITVLAMLIRPGDPALGQLMTISGYILHFRFILPAVMLLIISLVSWKYAGQTPAAE